MAAGAAASDEGLVLVHHLDEACARCSASDAGLTARRCVQVAGVTTFERGLPNGMWSVRRNWLHLSGTVTPVSRRVMSAVPAPAGPATPLGGPTTPAASWAMNPDTLRRNTLFVGARGADVIGPGRARRLCRRRGTRQPRSDALESHGVQLFLQQHDQRLGRDREIDLAVAQSVSRDIAAGARTVRNGSVLTPVATCTKPASGVHASEEAGNSLRPWAPGCLAAV